MLYRGPGSGKLVRKPWRWKWSRAAAHVTGIDPTATPETPGLLDLAAPAKRHPPDGNWRESICRRQDEQTLRRFRMWSNRGCPLGSDNFISKLETLPDPAPPPPQTRPPQKEEHHQKG